jgi:hypothetical protein
MENESKDRGFRRAENSPQADRIHIVPPEDLETAEGAISTLRGIAQAEAESTQ